MNENNEIKNIDATKYSNAISSTLLLACSIDGIIKSPMLLKDICSSFALSEMFLTISSLNFPYFIRARLNIE